MEQDLNTTFDNSFSEIVNLHWQPYIGKRYNNYSGETAVLIVGESHYKPENEDEDGYIKKEWTREFILKEGMKLKPWYNGGAQNPLVKNIGNVLQNNESQANKTEKYNFWESVAYFNIVQRLLPKLKERPTDADYEKGWGVFFEVIKIIRPTLIIFCGVEASNFGSHFKNAANKQDFTTSGIEKEEEKVGSTYPRLANISYHDEYSSKLIFVKHPSKHFPVSKWTDFVKAHTN